MANDRRIIHDHNKRLTIKPANPVSPAKSITKQSAITLPKSAFQLFEILPN